MLRRLKYAGICASILFAACSRSNNLFLGRVENTVAGHQIVVTDCYRTSVPQPEQLPGATWHYAPCRDADIWLRGDQLEVNGRAYGKIAPAASILVDHGVVSVNQEAKPAAAAGVERGVARVQFGILVHACITVPSRGDCRWTSLAAIDFRNAGPRPGQTVPYAQVPRTAPDGSAQPAIPGRTLRV
jgi:hypothetical protein